MCPIGDRDTVCELIDFIEAFKKEKAGTGYRRKVSIHYNFVGGVERLRYHGV